MKVFEQYPIAAPFPTIGDLFQCCDCGACKVYRPDGIGTGYARVDGRQLVCYECCARRDEKEMRETGRIVLYFSGDKVTNWPGTLQLPVYGVRHSWHNFAGRNGRTDFYFRAFGREWHGVNIGRDNQIARCKAMKATSR